MRAEVYSDYIDPAAGPGKAGNKPRTAVVLPAETTMLNFLLWLLLFVVCWPLALAALILYPIVWLLLLPLRLVGIAVSSVFELLHAVLTLPARLLRCA